MSRELKVTYNGASANLYAVIRRLSDGYVWSTVASAFAAWADGSVADYDVALTDRGGDLYDGDFPTSIPAGNYEVGYYERAGASPAITDTRLATDSPRWWDGTTLTSTSEITLSAYALTSLENQKRYMRITTSDDDTMLTMLINAVSNGIEDVAGRQFASRSRHEWYNVSGQRRLRLRQWPVTDIRRVAWGYGTALTVTYSGDAIRAEISTSETSVRISTTSSAGVVSTTNLLFSDYPATTSIAAAINLVSGWAATLDENVPSADLAPMAGTDTVDRAVALYHAERAVAIASVDYQTGVIQMIGGVAGWDGSHSLRRMGRQTGYETETSFPIGHQYVLVEYTAGYTTMPGTIELLCNRLVADAYYEGWGPRNMTKATLGPFSWTASPDQTQSIKAAVDETGAGDIPIGAP